MFQYNEYVKVKKRKFKNKKGIVVAIDGRFNRNRPDYFVDFDSSIEYFKGNLLDQITKNEYEDKYTLLEASKLVGCSKQTLWRKVKNEEFNFSRQKARNNTSRFLIQLNEIQIRNLKKQYKRKSCILHDKTIQR